MKFPGWKDLNKSELLIGLIFGLVFAVKIHLFAVLLAPVTAWLWAMGGADGKKGGNKLYRRAGCSILPVLVVFAVNRLWTSWAGLYCWIGIPFSWWDLAKGYGIPDPPDRPNPDPGSPLGRFCYYKLANKNENLAELYCRLILWTLLAISFLPVWLS